MILEKNLHKTFTNIPGICWKPSAVIITFHSLVEECYKTVEKPVEEINGVFTGIGGDVNKNVWKTGEYIVDSSFLLVKPGGKPPAVENGELTL